MECLRAAQHQHAPRRVRPRRPARGRGDRHAGHLPVTRVTLYTAKGCHLCERARSQLEALRGELAFELEEIDITGDPQLEASHREWLPVVEIDGERAFVYHLPEPAFRRRLAAAQSARSGPSL